MNKFKHQTGSIMYRRKSTGATVGREDWSLTRQHDGSRTLRTLGIAQDSWLVRDVSYTIGQDTRLTSAFVRVQHAAELVGSGYFRAQGQTLESVSDANDSGHTVQQLNVPRRFHIFTHTAAADGWLSWICELTPRREQAVTIYHTASALDGADGPLGRLKILRGIYLGEEEMAVPAGVFKTRKFRFDAEKFPVYDIWVTGKDNILVKAEWSGVDLEYLLVSIRADKDFNSGANP